MSESGLWSETARRLLDRQDLLTTDDLINAMQSDPTCVAARVLTHLEVDGLPVTNIDGKARGRHLENVASVAMGICREMESNRVTTGHLLVAILGDAWSGGGRALIDAGLYWESVWQLVSQEPISES